jgi:magnesium transporter
VLKVYVHRNGETQCVDRVESEWLDPSASLGAGPASKTTVWVDLVNPTPEEGRAILLDTFKFHPLSVEDALSEIHHPKIEQYGGYLYLILHGIDYQQDEHWFATRDIDFFLGPNYLVTVHDGQSRSITGVRDLCDRHERTLSEGAVGLLHRIVDRMVDNYRPEIQGIEKQMDELEDAAILEDREGMVKAILELKRDLSALRRVVIPQRDAIGRLARREFSMISDEMAYRFRDVYDHLVRLTDETIMLQDRVSAILDAYLSAVSNRLNLIVKVLTVMSTIFLPLTVLTSMWGMNIPLPQFPGGEALQFWWVAGIMLVISGSMLALFRRKRWI